jgi:GNAT superfamily N-acetyltransferase
MRIRDFQAATDIPSARTLFAQLGYPVSEEVLRRRVASTASDAVTTVLVAEGPAGVAGILTMHMIVPWHEENDWAVISALVVDDQVRGKGAGALLLSAAEEIARARKCSHVELSSSEARLRAHAFYERAGFKEVRKRFVKRL